MRSLRYILFVLFLICYRGLSAQEFDLYDFRYYKRFDTTEELLAPEKDTITEAKFILNREFTTRALDYNFSAVRYARRGKPYYERTTRLNGAKIPFISSSTIRALQLKEVRTIDETSLQIDTLIRARTSTAFSFSTRNMPYSISAATAMKLGKNWTLAANLSARTGRDMHVAGLFGNSLEINAAASKRWRDRHTLMMAIFAKPSMRSTRLASSMEAFRLTGDNLYNPAWGYQGGEIRSARIRRVYMPTAFVGYAWRINERTHINLAASLTAGVEKYSSLEWYDTQTPIPDNYRYLPSGYDGDSWVFHEVEQAWTNNDPRFTQIDFDYLITSNILRGNAAIYAISDRVRRTVNASFICSATTKLDNSSISYGVDANIVSYRNYKVMRDLLGAKYLIDLDYYLLDDDTFGNALQNNLFTPNRRVETGDRFGYDYALRRQELSIFANYRYSTGKLNIDAVAKVGYCDTSRRGFYRKELFADGSFGRSHTINLYPYLFRIKADYLIADNHYISGSLSTETRAGDEEDLFIQSQYNNRPIDYPLLRNCHDVETRYSFQRKNFALNTTLFLSTKLNDTQVRHLYYDLTGDFTDVVESYINTISYGVEAETQWRFANNFRLTAAATIGRYSYLTNSSITIYTDTENIVISDRVESYVKGLSIGNTPQIAITAGLSYYNKGWWIAANANYAGLRYIEPSLLIRTDRILNTAKTPQQRSELLKQERLRDAFTIDLSLSKSLYINRLSKRIYTTTAVRRFEDKYPRSRLVFRLGIRNLLGSSYIIYSGYESSRLQRYRRVTTYAYRHQPSRYMYAYPRTLYASATFAF